MHNDIGFDGFKRIWRAPKRVFKGGSLARLTPQGEYLWDRSRERFARRPDAYLAYLLPLDGEIGIVEGFRFIAADASDYPRAQDRA